MKVSELRNMTKAELDHTLVSLRDEYFKLHIRRSTEELPNPLRLRTIRRDIARILTLLREFELKSDKSLEKSKNAKA